VAVAAGEFGVRQIVFELAIMNKIPKKTTRLVLCHCQAKLFQVVRFEEFGVFLVVVCGGVGWYDRIIKLEQSEIVAFEQCGESALYALAYETSKDGHKEREWTLS
jgi:hypothetical protein